MGTCKQCGKKGLFLFVNSEGLCSECVSKAKNMKKEIDFAERLPEYFGPNSEYAKNMKWVSNQSDQNSELFEAMAQYKEDKNVDKIIAAYEKVLINTDNPLRANARSDELINLYLKNGYRDKAWAYLNKLSETEYYPRRKVRQKQAKILQKEKKYLDAIEKHLLASLNDAETYYSSKQLQKYTGESFKKDIGICLKHLSWDEDTINDVSNLLMKQVKKRRFDENELINVFRAYLNDKGSR